MHLWFLLIYLISCINITYSQHNSVGCHELWDMTNKANGLQVYKFKLYACIDGFTPPNLRGTVPKLLENPIKLLNYSVKNNTNLSISNQNITNQNITNQNITNQNFLPESSIITIQKVILGVFEKFIKSGLTESDRKSGTIYVLGSLTIVSQNAANSLPWLYESFMVQAPQNNN